MNAEERIVFFDGVCNLCNGLVKFILKHDKTKSIRFAAIQSRFAEKYDAGLKSFDSVVYVKEGTKYIKSDAILNIIRDMGGFIKLLYAFIIIPRFLRNAIYDLVARYRYRIFGRRESCMVPTAGIMERFMEN
ncbi:MAG TPA: DCC1-like thiol-disulfide oxidoreductase family protein [Bacteroidales bacterium]|nr:DCC1-like thiol-disulfide oxidoreductase family protein [Bacteroidales bacterium]